MDNDPDVDGVSLDAEVRGATVLGPGRGGD